jgi:hypothetical protein
MTKKQLTKVIREAVAAALSPAKGNSNACSRPTDRSSNIRAAIRSGRSKSAVRRQYRLTDYEYRGHKAVVTRMANGN